MYICMSYPKIFYFTSDGNSGEGKNQLFDYTPENKKGVYQIL
jgi:hypothetical protein